MLNLRKRIKDLQENTSSLEAREVCKEVLENFINLPESQIVYAIVEKLKNINDGDKHVAKFVQVTEKVESVNNLGVARAIVTIKESQIYTYPGLKYSLEKIENSLIYKQVKVVEEENSTKDFKAGETWSRLNMPSKSFKIQESNISGHPEYMLIDETIATLKNFIWDPVVEKVYNELKTRREEMCESIDIAIGMHSMKNNKGSFFFDSILSRLEEHFLSPTDSSRSMIIEDLRKLNFYPIAKKLSESLARATKTSSVQVISDNSKCKVSSIYSPVLLENGGEHFFVKGNFFKKQNKKIVKLTEEEVSKLPEKFREICRIINSPQVFIKEGKISFYLKRDKVEILENEKKVEVRFNGKPVTSTELAKNMVSAGLFRLEESKIAYDVQSIAESFENIFDIDFGKIIESNIYPGSYAILMKDSNKIYLNKVNESMRSNEFYSDLNATQTRNQILEFLGFDIKESMTEYLEKDEVELKELRESQIEIIKSISIVEANLSKVESAMENEFISNTPEVKDLKNALESEILSLRATHKKIAERIKAFENKTSSDAGFEVGEEIKLSETGELATVSSINSSRNSLIVVTASGKTVEVPVEKAVSVEGIISRAEEKNSTVAKKKLTETNNEISSDVGRSEDSVFTEVKNYVKAIVTNDQGGSYSGEEVEVLADDYTSKGEEEIIEVKVGDDIVFIEKKFIKLKEESLESAVKTTEKFTVPAVNSISGVANVKEDDDEDNEDDKDDEFIFSLDDLDFSRKDDKDDDEDDDEDDDHEDDETSGTENPFYSEPKPTDIEILRSKLKKSMKELQDIRSEMKNTFTSTDTISNTITSLKGMVDALKKDQEKLR